MCLGLGFRGCGVAEYNIGNPQGTPGTRKGQKRIVGKAFIEGMVLETPISMVRV